MEKEQTNYSERVNIGINQKDRRLVCESLSKLLADTYLLYLKTQNYHWNVTGKLFHSLHVLFEEQYLDLGKAVDTIAERIRALGEFAPATFSQFAKLTKIKEESGVPSAEQMIKNLIEDNEKVVASAQEVIDKCEEYGDDATEDMMITRLQIHEKNDWMLRSLISSPSGH